MRIATFLFAMTLSVAACSRSDGEAISESPEVSGDSVTAPDRPDSVSGEGSTASTDDGERTGSASSEDGSASQSSGGAVDGDMAIFRLAHEGPLPPALHWDSESIRKQSHTGEWFAVADGPFVEVAEIPAYGVVFQRSLDKRVVWLVGEAGPQELLVAADGQTLELEGAGETVNGDPVVFYQRHDHGSPEQTRSTLRSYNLVTEEVREILITGGWESSTSFSQLTGGTVVGTWSSEGWEGLTQVDLQTGTELFNSDDEHACFDGEPACPVYRQATVLNRQIYGVRSIWNEERQLVDAAGVFAFDPATGFEERVVEFPWDNGLWYAEDMFAHGEQLVISLKDGNDQPLPALVVDLASGETWTLPEAAFVRPAYLS